MALEISDRLCFVDNCETLRVLETTGAYNVTTNPTGWGAPNATLASVTAAQLSITLPSGTSEDFDITATITGGTIIDGEFVIDELTMEDFGGSADTKFDDGIYTVAYTVTAGGTDYAYNTTVFSTCQVACCLEKMKTKFEEKLCGCDWDTYWTNYNKAKVFLNAAKRAYACNDTTKANTFLASVKKICKFNSCSC